MKARDRRKENRSRDSHDFTELDTHTHFYGPDKKNEENGGGGGGDCGNGRKNDAVINANQVEVAAAAERIQLALDLSAKLMLLMLQSHLHNQKEKGNSGWLNCRLRSNSINVEQMRERGKIKTLKENPLLKLLEQFQH